MDYILNGFRINKVAKLRKIDWHTVKNHIESDIGKAMLDAQRRSIRMRFEGALDKVIDRIEAVLDINKFDGKTEKAIKAVLDITGFSVGARQAEAQRIQKTEKTGEDSTDMAKLRKQWDAEDEAIDETHQSRKIKSSIQ